MVVENEITRAVFVGKKFISIGDVKQIENKILFKPIGGLPFFNQYVHVLANANELPVQERLLWRPSVGDTQIRVKVFFSDLRNDKFSAVMNPQDIIAINTLRNENEALLLQNERLLQLLKDSNNDDRMKKRIKTEIDFYNQVKGFGGGGGGGMYDNYQQNFPTYPSGGYQGGGDQQNI